MNDFDQLLANMTDDVYQRLCTAVEIGKWPDGECLETAQIEMLLQLTIAYSSKNNLHGNELFGINSKGVMTDGTILKKAFIQNKNIPININDSLAKNNKTTSKDLK